MRTPAADSTLERPIASEDAPSGCQEVASPQPLSREERSIRGVGGRVWVVAARMAGILATIAANVIAGRYLSKADFGELSVVLNICTFGSLVAGAGMNRTLVRLIAERLAERDSSATQSLLRIGQRLLNTSLLATAILFAGVLALIGHQFTGRAMSLSLAVAAAAMVLTFGWHQVVGELLRALHAVRLAALFGAPPWAAGIERAFGQQPPHHVDHLKRHQQRVGDRPRAEQRRHHGVAQEAEQARRQGSGRNGEDVADHRANRSLIGGCGACWRAVERDRPQATITPTLIGFSAQPQLPQRDF